MKKTVKLFCVALAALSYIQDAVAQTNPYPWDYFTNPVDIPVSLSGGYGEIRPNHFHAGIDIRTQQTINKNVIAAADGYVWRIRVGGNGYGKAIYIKHPAGYVTLHGHLTSFAPEIEKWVRMYQYENQVFEFDIEPDSVIFPVKRGDLIAYSGNTGSSGGPHVHFEVRDAKGEVALNPLFFGFIKEDRQKPYFASVTLYPLSKTSYINKKITDQSFAADYRDSTYTAVFEHKKKIKRKKYKITPDTIRVYGTFGVGVEVFDRIQGIRTNINKIEVYVDDKQTFGYKLDEFKFKETRGVNALIDYEDKLASNEKTQKLFLQPNEKLGFIRKDLGSGEITFSDNNLHLIRVVATDAFGNQNTLQFNVKSEQEFAELKPHPDKSYVQVMNYNREEKFITSDLEVTFPKDVLYDTLFFRYAKGAKTGGLITPVHKIHTPYTALADNIEIKIKTGYIKPELQKKLVMVSAGKGLGSIGGTYKDGWVTAKTVYFGSYAVAMDTKAPSITRRGLEPDFVLKKGKRGKMIKVKVKKAKRSKKGKKGAPEPPPAPRKMSDFTFSISDNLSGIDRHDAYVDDVWVLTEFDPKSATLTYRFDENITPQSTCFRLEVLDKCGNKAVYETEINNIIIVKKGPGQYQ